MIRICHITTVHSAKDVRIFHKECKSLAKHGYDVKLIVVNSESFTEDGVEVIGVPCKYSGRLQRIFKAPRAALRMALKVDADIYHFHDPELLLIGRKLKKRGKKVIYDAHEDVPRQILSKYWINGFIRKSISAIAETMENRICGKLDLIITATPFIRDRFLKISPDVTDINNFPVADNDREITGWQDRKKEVCYIGGITEVRGALEMVKAMSGLNNVSLHLAGTFSPVELRDKIINTNGWQKVKEYGFVDRHKAVEIMNSSMAGLVTLHPIINYVDSLPVKMFEYMAHGIPVIASDFPLWKQIIEINNCGICVNPLKPEQIAEAIENIINNPQKAAEMGNNGIRLVKEKYNWDKEESKLISAYNSLIKE